MASTTANIKNDDTDGDDGDDLRVTLSLAEFEAVKGQEFVFFYKSSDVIDDVEFDSDGDERLLKLHQGDPLQFESRSRGMESYESLVTRSKYICKLHPQVEAMQEYVSQQLSGVPSPEDIIVLVYRRDSAASSDVSQRRQNPFNNSVNGLATGVEASLILFSRYSFEPKLRAVLVWEKAPRINSTLGTVAFRIDEAFEKT